MSILARNDSNQVLTNVQAVIRYYNAQGQLLETQNTFGDLLSRVGPSEQVGVFGLPPLGATTYVVDLVAGFPTNVPPNRDFQLGTPIRTASGDGYYFWSVEVTNVGGTLAEDVTVMAVCSGTSGVVVFDMYGPGGLGSVDLDPGEKGLVNRIFSSTDPSCNTLTMLVPDSRSTPTIRQPSAPANLSFTRQYGGVKVQWSAPGSLGNVPITGYTVSGGPEGPVTVGATQTSVTLTGMLSPNTYAISVKANTDWGSSPPATGTTTPLPPPSVTNVAAAPIIGGGLISWEPPPNAAAPAPTGYQVVLASGAPISVPADQLSVDLSGLKAPETYSVAVYAVGPVGKSPPATVSLAPTPPPPPVDVEVVPVVGGAELTWSEPATGGAPPPDSYRVLVDNTLVASLPSTATNHTVTGLAYPNVYEVAVEAQGAAGRSNPTGASLTPLRPIDSSLALTQPQPTTFLAGSDVLFAGALSIPEATGSRSVTLSFQPVRTGRWSAVDTFSTADGVMGEFAFEQGAKVRESGIWKIRFQGSFGTEKPSDVTHPITARSWTKGWPTQSTTKVAGATVRRTITLSPSFRRKVVLERRSCADCRWREMDARRAPSGAKGTATLSLSVPRGVSWWRVVLPATAVGTKAVSEPWRIRGS